ncbi:MAG: MFS transporter [Dehalococcoidales bacterium]|nr:MFS transporter [Dehalococcoidales bacterium]
MKNSEPDRQAINKTPDSDSVVDNIITQSYQSQLPRKQVITALVGTVLTMFLGTIFMTLTSTAMPRIVTDLGGFSHYTWVQTAYMITECVSVPLSGKLSDMFGRKWILVTGMSIFVIGSLLCGFSQTMEQLIIFRAVQGLGFGAMQALGFIIIADIFPPEERGKYSGIMAGVFGFSTVIGPTLGGIITDVLSWRWCFWVTVPIGMVIILVFIFLFPKIKISSNKPRIDFFGVIAMTLAIVPLILGLSLGGVDYEWNSVTVIGLFILSAASLAVFIFIESRTAEPIIPLGLFRNRVVTISSIVCFLHGMLFFPIIIFIPLFFQGVLGATATESGGFMTPMMLSMAFGSFIGGQLLSRTGGRYRLQATIAFGIASVGFFLLSGMSPQTTLTTAIIYIVIVGFANGNIMPVHTIAVQNSVPYTVLGTATSLISLVRPLGGVFGLAIVGAILNNRFASQFMTNLSPEVSAVVPPEQLTGILNNPQALISPDAYTSMESTFEGMGSEGIVLFQNLITILRESLNSALTQMFLFVAFMAVLSLVINLWLKGIPPHRPRVEREKYKQ